MSRGTVTDAVRAAAKDTLGIDDIGLTELRLMPYVQYVMMNEQRIKPEKVNNEERAILQRWRERGFMEGGAGGMYITREFWDGINAVLWHAYVDHD